MRKKNVVRLKRKPKWRKGYHSFWKTDIGVRLFIGGVVLLALVMVRRTDIVEIKEMGDIVDIKEAGGGTDLACYDPYILDGDTLECDGERVRLVGIDAPEMPGHCRPGRKCVQGDPVAAKEYLELVTAGLVECVSEGRDHYDRTLGRCSAGGVDLSCAMIKEGHAERRYGNIICR